MTPNALTTMNVQFILPKRNMDKGETQPWPNPLQFRFQSKSISITWERMLMPWELLQT